MKGVGLEEREGCEREGEYGGGRLADEVRREKRREVSDEIQDGFMVAALDALYGDGATRATAAQKSERAGADRYHGGGCGKPFDPTLSVERVGVAHRAYDHEHGRER